MNKAQRGRSHMWGFAALLVAVGWLVTPNPVPVYDGLGMPDHPYRYVKAPPHLPVTAKPTGDQDTLPLVGGVNSKLASLLSDEVGPQVSAYFPIGALAARSGLISVKVTPEAPTDPPTDGPIDGNVYRVSIANPAGPVTFTAVTSHIYLRALGAKQPGPVMVHRRGPGQAWQLLQTSRTGNDVYGSVLPEAGQYALVYSKRAQPSEVGFAGVAGSGILGGHLVLVVVALLTLLVLISVVLAVRWRGSNVDP